MDRQQQSRSSILRYSRSFPDELMLSFTSHGIPFERELDDALISVLPKRKQFRDSIVDKAPSDIVIELEIEQHSRKTHRLIPALVPIPRKAYSFNVNTTEPASDGDDVVVAAMATQPRRWGSTRSCHAEFFESLSNSERDLRTRRESTESSVQKLYNERKDHIFELFQDSWIISDDLDDEMESESKPFAVFNRAA